MSIDASAVARVLGIETTFEDMRAGGVLFLPQHIAVIAQGSSDSVYSLAKFRATSAGAVGARIGYGSPMHKIARQLFPANGDGVGTIPVTFFPLEDDDSGAPSEGKIVPSGTQTLAAQYRVSIAGVLSRLFVIAAGATVQARCISMHDAINAILEMPVNATYTYGTVTSAPGGGNVGNGTVTVLSAPGNPIPGDYVLTCITEVANGGVFSLVDPNGDLVADDIAMTPGVGGATVITEGGLQFTLTDGTEDFDEDDTFTITVPVTEVLLTSKWAGESANDIIVSVEGEDLGTTFAITQPVGGLVNPDVTAALGLMGNVWYTMVINGLNIEDTTALDALQSVGEGRWGQLVRKPFVAFTGVTDADVDDATAICDARPTDRINAQLTAPGSVNLPCVVAARQVARIAKVANNNPPTDYGSQRATGLTPGDDGVQWDYAMRDQAVKAGSSTIEVKNSVVCVSDVVTFYHPTGEEPPPYRHVCDIVKLQNIIFNIDLIFNRPEWDGAPLIPDDQPTVNPNARKPKTARAEVSALLDSLGLQAIISDPKTAKKNTRASINSQNPKRLDLRVPVQVSGNSNIISVDLLFGFFFGTAAQV